MNRILTMLCLFFLTYTLLFLSGCDKSGYGMGPTYEIDGMVYTGLPVKGTVHLETFKRFDHYAADIQPDGTYHISITKEDPPYLLWADIDGNRTLYSYSEGGYNPTQNEINTANANPTASSPVYYQTVNITPLTDMIIGLACLEDPEERYSVRQYPGFPASTKIKEHQGHIQDLFKDVFTGFGHPKGYNLLHDDLLHESNIKKLINCLEVDYTQKKLSESDTVEKHVIDLLPTKGSPIFYEYNLDDNTVITNMDSDKVAGTVNSLLSNPN